MFLRFPSTRNRQAKLRFQGVWVNSEAKAGYARHRAKEISTRLIRTWWYLRRLPGCNRDHVHTRCNRVCPPSASSVPIVPDILRFRGWNNYNWSNLVLRTIYLLRSLSKQLPHNLSRPFLTLSIARERDSILSSFDQLPPFYTCICIHDRGQNWVERFNSIVFKI